MATCIQMTDNIRAMKSGQERKVTGRPSESYVGVDDREIRDDGNPSRAPSSPFSLTDSFFSHLPHLTCGDMAKREGTASISRFIDSAVRPMRPTKLANRKRQDSSYLMDHS